MGEGGGVRGHVGDPATQPPAQDVGHPVAALRGMRGERVKGGVVELVEEVALLARRDCPYPG